MISLPTLGPVTTGGPPGGPVGGLSSPAIHAIVEGSNASRGHAFNLADSVQLSSKAREAADQAHQHRKIRDEAESQSRRQPPQPQQQPAAAPEEAADERPAPTAKPTGVLPAPALSPEQQAKVSELQDRQKEVRLSDINKRLLAGPWVSSPSTFSFAPGPDGRNYVVEGHTPVNTAPIDGDPVSTLWKMKSIRHAMLHASPPPDRGEIQVAREAEQVALQAAAELRQQMIDRGRESLDLMA